MTVVLLLDNKQVINICSSLESWQSPKTLVGASFDAGVVNSNVVEPKVVLLIKFNDATSDDI